MLSVKIPKAKLVIIGGAEDKGDRSDIQDKNITYEQFEILKELLPERRQGKRDKRYIEIVTTASAEPDLIREMYEDAFRELGYQEIGFMHIDNDHGTRDPRFIKRIRKAHTVLFSGGDQFRLSTVLGNSDVLDVILDRYLNDPDFILAGTSAGAMAMATLMIFEGENNEALLKGAVKISSGLGFLDHCIVDTHFIKRGRFGRLAEAIIMNPICIGIGLGEDTALIIRKGNIAECRGSGMVIIIDGRHVGHTNIPYVKEKTPLCIENLTVHILSKGTGFLLRERKFIPSDEDLDLQRPRKS